MDYETASANLDSLIKWAKLNDSFKTRNEAATRLHLIDKLLENCLGWPINQIDPERYHAGDYSDYELGLPAKRLVVEAKREGKYFELPAGFSEEICKIKTLFDTSRDVHEAIKQAMRYCQQRSIPIGAVANGHQLIVFLGSRQDSIPPEEGLALIFDSLDTIRFRFLQLWNTLSPDGIDSRFIFTLLNKNRPNLPPEKLAKRIVDYPGYKNRNSSAAELQILGGLFLEDITKLPDFEEEFVKETYCESGALSQYALVSKEILATRYTSHFEKETRITTKPVRTKKGLEPELRSDLVAASMSQRPILLVGDVGVGKSMFIKRLLFVDAKDILEQAIVLNLDFGSKPALARDLSSYVTSEFERQLRIDYSIDVDERNFVRGVYHSEIQRFAKGIYADLKETNPEMYREKEIENLSRLLTDREQHLKSCFQHIVSGQNRPIVIFFDNVDQRPLDFQEQAFLITQAFAQNWPVTAFIALRPDTFAHSRSKGTLSAYQPRVFTIDPPRVDRVIQKRLEYALTKLQSVGRLPTFPKGFTLSSNSLESYIQMLKDAFSKSQDLVEFVDNLSNGNLRKALDFVGAFVGSGHVDTDKIFKAIEKDGRYELPLHEFLRAVIYGNNEHFDPSESPVLNIFDVSTNNKQEHFLVLLLLSMIERAGTLGRDEGFVPLSKIYDSLQGYGFSEYQIQTTIERTIIKDLITPPKIQNKQSFDRLRIMTAGAYSAKRLVSVFSYVDAVIVDTPIIDTEYRNKIQPANSIVERLDRAEIFVNYLDSCWDSSFSEYYDWPSHSTQLVRSIASIRIQDERRKRFSD